VPRWLAVLAESELEFYSATRLLRRYSLVDVDGQQTESHKIHAVLHEWCRYLSEDDEQESMLLLALRVVAQAVPAPSETAYRELQRRLLPHGMHVYAKLELSQRCHDWTLLDKDGSLAWIAHSLGHLFAAQGKLVESEAMYQQALAGYDKTLGPKHTSTLNTVNNLGNLYSNQGKLAEAEQMYDRALAGYEEALGSAHTSTLRTLNSLGNLYYAQGKLAEAETMYNRALIICTEILGHGDQDTLCVVRNFSLLCRKRHCLNIHSVNKDRIWSSMFGAEKHVSPKYIVLVTRL
jgi:tetratricopeptide (TPR) repeat protein